MDAQWPTNIFMGRLSKPDTRLHGAYVLVPSFFGDIIEIVKIKKISRKKLKRPTRNRRLSSSRHSNHCKHHVAL